VISQVFFNYTDQWTDPTRVLYNMLMERILFAMKGKLNIALALTLACTVIILINTVMSRNVSQINQSITSIYNDRMLAGQDISGIIEMIYKNQLLTEEHIRSREPALCQQLEKNLACNQSVADSLISHFKKTVLTSEERTALKLYEHRHQVHQSLQAQLIALSRAGEKEAAYQAFLQQGRPAFQRVLIPAHQLVAIQASVGKQIYHTVHQDLQTAKLLSHLETSVVIIIGVVILALLKTSHLIIPKAQKYWLN